MAGMILIKTLKEEELLLKLVQEFSSKVHMPRSFVPNETFKSYALKGCYGITGVEKDKDVEECLFQIELSPNYLGFIDYMILKCRSVGVVLSV